LARDIDLIVFDVDGTLISHPSGRVVWQELNDRFGVSPDITRQRHLDHTAGRLAYSDWVRLDVGDWQHSGATRAQLIEGVAQFELRPGVRQTMAELKRRRPDASNSIGHLYEGPITTAALLKDGRVHTITDRKGLTPAVIREVYGIDVAFAEIDGYPLIVMKDA
jgi:beta-phosphoglucomutase-like phosphatase (HAD superfamily)